MSKARRKTPRIHNDHYYQAKAAEHQRKLLAEQARWRKQAEAADKDATTPSGTTATAATLASSSIPKWESDILEG